MEPTATEHPAQPRRPRARRRALLWSAAGVVALGGAYAAAQWHTSGQIARGTTVAGIDVGGLTAPDAVSTLDARLAELSRQPVAVTTSAAEATMVPADAGLAVDSAGTVDSLTRFTLHPARLWVHLRGGREVAPDVVVDRDVLDDTASRLAGELTREPVDGTVAFADGDVVVTPATHGSQVDAAAIASIVEAGWLTPGEGIAVPHDEVAPSVTQEVTDAAYAVARQIVSEPVVVTVAGQQAEVPGAALADAVTFEYDDGALAPRFDGDVLLAAVVDRVPNLLSTPVDARFEFVGGRPQIAGGTPGTTIDADTLAAAIEVAALSAVRTTQVDVVEQDPEVTADDLAALGVRENVAHFTTSLTNDQVRTDNIRLGSQRITGTLIRPGETFSLLETLGPITTAAGFGNAPVIVGGQLVPGVGGGLSQLATNVFNAGFFAGFEIVEHRPHSMWIPRYPAGREATIAVGSIDLRLRNNTPYGAVLGAFVSGNQLTVQVWSTEHFRVETTQGERRNVVPAVTNHSTAPGCRPRSAGSDGFTITNTRRVFRGSTLVIDEAHTWTYRADHGTACDPPPQTHPDPPADGEPDTPEQ
jgi:vancomycin resistance protein YoaR